MLGYKAFSSDLTCRDFQYEIGKTYELEKEQTLQICKCGFHFCKDLKYVYIHYPPNSRVAIVEALGDIQQLGYTFATDKIKIIMEIPESEIKKMRRIAWLKDIDRAMKTIELIKARK